MCGKVKFTVKCHIIYDKHLRGYLRGAGTMYLLLLVIYSYYFVWLLLLSWLLWCSSSSWHRFIFFCGVDFDASIRATHNARGALAIMNRNGEVRAIAYLNSAIAEPVVRMCARAQTRINPTRRLNNTMYSYAVHMVYSAASYNKSQSRQGARALGQTAVGGNKIKMHQLLLLCASASPFGCSSINLPSIVRYLRDRAAVLPTPSRTVYSNAGSNL